MEITIKIEGLDQLTESLALIGAALAYKNDMAPTAESAVKLMNEVTATTEEVEKPKKAKDPETKKETKKAKDPETKKEEVKVTEEPKKEEADSKAATVSREEVRAALVAKNSPSTRDKLKAILDKYEAPNITALKEEHFEDVLKELEAL